jgi:hypothetical protein
MAWKRYLLAFVLAVLGCIPASAQQNEVNPCVLVPNTAMGITLTGCQGVSATNPLPVTPSASGAPITNANPLAVNISQGGAAVTAANPLPVGPNQYPAASTAITAIATGTTAVVTATLAGVAAKTTYICGFDISAAGSATISPITIGGLLGGTYTFQGLSAGGTPFNRTYTPCIPASAVNTAITVNTTADATATAVDVQAWGFQQ